MLNMKRNVDNWSVDVWWLGTEYAKSFDETRIPRRFEARTPAKTTVSSPKAGSEPVG